MSTAISPVTCSAAVGVGVVLAMDSAYWASRVRAPRWFGRLRRTRHGRLLVGWAAIVSYGFRLGQPFLFDRALAKRLLDAARALPDRSTAPNRGCPSSSKRRNA